MTIYPTGDMYPDSSRTIHIGNYYTDDSTRGEMLYDLRNKYGEGSVHIGPAIGLNPDIPLRTANMAGVYVAAEALQTVQVNQLPEA